MQKRDMPPTQLGKDAAQVTAFLEKLFDDYVAGDGAPHELIRAMEYASANGGKRIRAGLVMGAARFISPEAGSAVGVIRVAAAVECLHAYSLIHDDLPAMDDAAMRRGKPSCHAAFGEATAILAGDALQSLAFELLADAATHPDGGVRARLCLELARASGAGGMAGGQLLDLEAASRDFDIAEVARMQAMKTGALITASIRMGAIAAAASDPAGGASASHNNIEAANNIDENILAALTVYGDAIGAAYQIADDLLDAGGDAELAGKPLGRDAGQGKASLVSRLGAAEAESEAERLIATARNALREVAKSPPQNPDYLLELAEFVIRRDR